MNLYPKDYTFDTPTFIGVGDSTYTGVQTFNNTILANSNLGLAGTLVMNSAAPILLGSNVDNGTGGRLQIVNSVTGNVLGWTVTSYGGVAISYLRAAAGTLAAPMAATTAQECHLNFRFYNGQGDTAGNWIGSALIHAKPTSTHSATNSGADLLIGAAPDGTNTRVDTVRVGGAGVVISKTAVGAQDASTVLDLQGINGGLGVPNLTKAQRNAITSPKPGLQVYQTDNTPGLRVFENGAWVKYTATADP